ncbi:ABC transporter permease [Nocardioides immobilis]|uniref:ABC transporter permease n=1 Tax=Nocardioides immobilis TaxID=2049295 RepID=A0A417Y9H0_9ACTN|nr:ABC transporter permease [Nocardioides immobilis]
MSLAVQPRTPAQTQPQPDGLEAALRREARRVRRLNTRDIALAVCTPLALLVAWEVMGRTGSVDVRIFPPPTQLASDGVDLVQSGRLQEAFEATVVRLLIGYATGAVGGIAVGMAMGLIRPIRAALDPLFSALYSLPKIAILPILLLIFGFTETPRILLITFGVFFIMQINTLSGLRHVDARLMEAASAYRARGWRKFRFVLFPATLPAIFTGLRVSAGMAVIIVTSVEFVAADNGLGFLIWNSWQIFQPGTMYVAMATVAALGAGLTGLIVWAERVALPWRNDRNPLRLRMLLSGAAGTRSRNASRTKQAQ